jgi:cell division septation protein DedD
MRWLFLLLLSLNFAYIAWQMSLPAADSYVKVPPLKNVPAIVLLSEVQTEQAEQVAQANGSPELTAPALTRVSPAVAESPVADDQGAAHQAGDEAAAAEEVPEKVVAVIPESKPAEQVPVVATTVPEPVVPEQKGGCFTLGPFRDLGKLRSLIREIKSYVVVADFRGREEKEQYLYWVYVEPENNMSEAMKTGERLKANKIKDFYVIREGEHKYGVSLGRFRNKASALRLEKKASKLGFDVLVEPVFKTVTVYWLDYQLADGVSIPETIFDQYMQSNKTDEVSRLVRDCDS